MLFPTKKISNVTSMIFLNHITPMRKIKIRLWESEAVTYPSIFQL